MESIRDQAKAKETAAAADDEGDEEEDNADWDGNFRKNIQEEGEEGGGGSSDKGNKGRSAKDGSYNVTAREKTLATASTDVEY